MSNLRDINFLDRYSNPNLLLPTEIIRYSNRNKIKKENLAEHSFYVALFVILVGNDYHINQNVINKAAALAVVHDLPEIYTLDLAHDLKYKHKDIKERFEEIEKLYIEEELPSISHMYNDLAQDNLAHLLVKIGDALSVNLYVNRELDIWNNNQDMKIISNEIKVRLSELFSKIEKYKNDYLKTCCEDFTTDQLESCMLLPYGNTSKEVYLKDCLDALENVPEEYLDNLTKHAIRDFIRLK